MNQNGFRYIVSDNNFIVNLGFLKKFAQHIQKKKNNDNSNNEVLLIHKL